MSNDNLYVPNPLPPSNPDKEADKEMVLKENFNQELLKNLNSKNTEFILPDEVKEKKRKEE